MKKNQLVDLAQSQQLVAMGMHTEYALRGAIKLLEIGYEVEARDILKLLYFAVTNATGKEEGNPLVCNCEELKVMDIPSQEGA